jgi:hypothetical protein
MNTAGTILSWALAGAPTSPEPFTVADVDMHRTADVAQLTAYDPDGEVTGEVFVWVDPEGRARLDAVFSDGLYLSVIADGVDATIDTDDGAEVVARMGKINAALGETAELPEWGGCALAGGLAVLHCGTLRPILCAAETFAAGCECVEYFTDGENSCWD